MSNKCHFTLAAELPGSSQVPPTPSMTIPPRAAELMGLEGPSSCEASPLVETKSCQLLWLLWVQQEPRATNAWLSQRHKSSCQLLNSSCMSCSPHVVFLHLEMLVANFPSLQDIGCGVVVFVWFFFFITSLCMLTAFNALVASALLSGAVILLHCCRQEGGLLMICLNSDPWWNSEGATVPCDPWCPL